MRFEFATATKIVFGSGSLHKSGAALKALGGQALVVTGGNTERSQPLQKVLREQGLSFSTFAISGEPTIERVQEGVQYAQAERCDLVIGFGGGSAIDAAKAIAGLLTYAGKVLDYLEVVGQGKPLVYPAAPFVAIPTTAGAGAEVTKNAVLASTMHKVKASLRSPYLLARVAIIDPELSIPLPAAITASTGLDALTQLIEPFVSCRANPMTDSLCREGMSRISRSLKPAFDNGKDIDARADMSLASLFSGLALANAGLGAVHGFAAPIGGAFAAPHGAVCAALLPPVIEVNCRALRERQPENSVLRRYDEVAHLLTDRAQATAEDAVQWVGETTKALGIPPLRTYGLTSADVPGICQKAAAASSMKGNPLPLTDAELCEILERAL